MFNDFPWLKPAWENLKSGLDSDRIHGALLLQSNKGLAVEKLVEFLVMHFFVKTTAAKLVVSAIAVN